MIRGNLQNKKLRMKAHIFVGLKVDGGDVGECIPWVNVEREI